MHGIRILTYIDDYLICSCSQAQALSDCKAVINHLISLGFRINWPKSHLVPTQCVKYLGLKLNSLSYHTIRVENFFIHPVRCAFSAGKSGFIQAVSASPGPHGLTDFSCATRGSDDDGFSEMGCLAENLLPSPPLLQGENFACMRGSSLTSHFSHWLSRRALQLSGLPRRRAPP